jgi:hypothetical protein
MRGTYHIKAPVKTVFDFFFDPRKGAELFPGTEIRELKMTEEGTGTYTSYRTKMAGIPFDVFSVYTEVVPNKHITEKSSNALVGTWDYSFESEGKGTKVTMEHHSRSFWGIPPLSTMGDLVTARMNQSFMRRVKDHIEASS